MGQHERCSVILLLTYSIRSQLVIDTTDEQERRRETTRHLSFLSFLPRPPSPHRSITTPDHTHDVPTTLTTFPPLERTHESNECVSHLHPLSPRPLPLLEPSVPQATQQATQDQPNLKAPPRVPYIVPSSVDNLNLKWGRRSREKRRRDGVIVLMRREIGKE